MKIVLIPCALSEWREEGRLLGRVEVLPTPEGEREAATWAEALRPLGLAVIHHSPDDLATKTAKIIAKALGVKPRKSINLAEVDVGLWAGLTESDLQKRFETAYHELCESPLNVSPPDGEAFADARQRLTAELQKLLKKSGDDAVALVLRPLALSLVLSSLEGVEAGNFWEHVREIRMPFTLDHSY